MTMKALGIIAAAVGAFGFFASVVYLFVAIEISLITSTTLSSTTNMMRWPLVCLVGVITCFVLALAIALPHDIISTYYPRGGSK